MATLTTSFRATTRMLALALVLACLMALAARAGINVDPFVGKYAGSAEVVSADGSSQDRDMSVEISETRKGFSVKWSTITFKPDGRVDEKAYQYEFVQGPREGLYAAAQKKNVFGHDVQHDPLEGEPYVWGQISGETMTVYALFVDPTGGYVMQQYDRTLTDGGLQLEFNSVANGDKQRTVSAFLERE